MNRKIDDPLNLGTTLALPIQVNAKGGFQTVSGIEAVEAHVKGLISIKKGQLPFTPSVGVDARAFEPGTPLKFVERYIHQSIVDYEDRIDPGALTVTASKITEDPCRLRIVITYSIFGDGTVRSFESDLQLTP